LFLQKKRKVVFNYDEVDKLVTGWQLALASGSPASWRKTGLARVTPSATTQNAKEELEPLSHLGASSASGVPLSISSSDSEGQEGTVPPTADLGSSLK